MDRTRITFVEAAITGQVTSEALDDYIGDWHDGTSTEPLHTYLGFSWEDYAHWVEKPSCLEALLNRYFRAWVAERLSKMEAALVPFAHDTER